MSEFRSLCLIDDPSMDADDGSSGEDVDDYLPPPDAPDGYDLITAAPGIVTVTTGVMTGRVQMIVHVLDAEPAGLAEGDWDTIEEIGFRALSASTRAASGQYYPFAADGDDTFSQSVTPAGAGHYRVRAYEVNRHRALGEHFEETDDPTDEHYLVEVWPQATTDESLRRIVGTDPPLLR